MGIGSSKGAFYHDEFHEEAAPWMIHPKDEDSKDNNVIDPEVDPKGTVPLENPIILVGMKEPFNKDQTPRLEPGGIGGVEIRSGTQMRKGANDNVKDLVNPNMKEVEQLARKLGESENGKGTWNTMGAGGQEHYIRDAAKVLKQPLPRWDYQLGDWSY